jgi:hypothetical protein
MEASPSFDPRRLRIGALLLRGGLLDAEQLAEALDEKEATGERLGQIVLRRGWVTEEALARTLADQSGLEFVDLDTYTRESRAEILLSGKLARYFRCVPLAVLDEQTILVAAADPTSPLLEDIPTAIGYEIRVAIATETAIDRALALLDPEGAPEPATPFLDPPVDEPAHVSAFNALGEPLLRVVSPAAAEEPELPAEHEPEPVAEAGTEAAPETVVEHEEPRLEADGEPAWPAVAAPEQAEAPWLPWQQPAAETAAEEPDDAERADIGEPLAAEPDPDPDGAAHEEPAGRTTDPPWLAWQPPEEAPLAAVDDIEPWGVPEPSIVSETPDAPELAEAVEHADIPEPFGTGEPAGELEPAGAPEPLAFSWLVPDDEAEPAAAEDVPEPAADAAEPDPVVAAAQEMIATLTGSNRQQLGMMLLQRGLLTPGQLVEVLLEQEETGIRLGTVIAGRGWISQTELARVLAEQHELEYFDLGAEPLAAGAGHLLPEWAARAYRAVPVRLLDDGSLLAAVADPTDLPDLTSQAGRSVQFAVSAASDVERAIERLYAKPEPEPQPEHEAEPESEPEARFRHEQEPEEELEHESEPEATPLTEEDVVSAEEPTTWAETPADLPAALAVERAVDADVAPTDWALAADEPADDPSPEPTPVEAWFADPYDVGDRTDEPAYDPTLAEALGTPLDSPRDALADEPDSGSEPESTVEAESAVEPDAAEASSALLDLVDELATEPVEAPELTVSEPVHALPEALASEGGDLPAEPLPGEPAEVAPLVTDGSTPVARLDELGLGPDEVAAVQTAIEQPHGLVLAIGPAGSGRTTTLRTAVALRSDTSRELIEIASKSSYGKALRSAVQATPGILLVDDLEHAGAARAAIDAALRGHLVLSTLHAPTVGSALARLTAAGVDRQVLAATLSCIVGQRLARRLCPLCREPYEAGRSSLIAAGFGDTYLPVTPFVGVYRAHGCAQCDGGYAGRVGLFEALTVSGPIRRVLEAGSASDIDGAAAYGGTRTLRSDGLRHCIAGRTTLDEVRRVVGNR